ncbi:RHG27 protein, partial [Turnix velox]|nr:RHG27 protein [Turnix velox]
LARVTPMLCGATTMGRGGDPPEDTHPLGKSCSETLHGAGRDRDTARRWPGSGHTTQGHKEPEEQSTPIYLNLKELQEEAAATSSWTPKEASSSQSDWETHTDTESGHLFYYNPVTGETTWDCPFGRAEDG